LDRAVDEDDSAAWRDGEVKSLLVESHRLPFREAALVEIEGDRLTGCECEPVVLLGTRGEQSLECILGPRSPP
jgi:hypothetical protein